MTWFVSGIYVQIPCIKDIIIITITIIIISIAKGKLEMRNFTTEDDDTMGAMNKDDIHRYLGHMQSKQMKQAQMKQQLAKNTYITQKV